jgi:hypothetical protein
MKRSTRTNWLILWGALSFASLAIGFLWSMFEAESSAASSLRFWGFFSSLIFVAFLSKPSTRPYGQIVFVFSVIMILGINFKILSLTGANATIVVGLIGIFASYGVLWFREKKTS